MRRLGGGTFSLSALDAAEAFTALNKPTQLAVSGRRSGGEILTTSFAFDGINDSVGGQADFQTFVFGQEPDW